MNNDQQAILVLFIAVIILIVVGGKLDSRIKKLESRIVSIEESTQ